MSDNVVKRKNKKEENEQEYIFINKMYTGSYLDDNDGNNITAKIPITTIKQIINTNYNIRIIGFSSGIYMFEFDRAAFEQFLKDNGL